MDETAAGGHSDLPLVFKISFGSDNRRVTYPRGRHCHFDSLRGTIERLFSLSASSFFLAYTDDDGDETAIKSDPDLAEAIQYFGSGFDDTLSSYTSVTQSTSASFDSSLPGGGSGGEKVTLRIQVVVEYDGPALSETGSIAESLSDRESGWGGGGGGEDGQSEHSSQWTEGSEDWEDQAERDRRDGIASGTRVIIEDDWDDESIDLSHDPFLPPQAVGRLGAPPAHPLAQSFSPSDSSSESSESAGRRGSSNEMTARNASASSAPSSEEGSLSDFESPHPSYEDSGTIHPGQRDEEDVLSTEDGGARTSTPYDDATSDEPPFSNVDHPPPTPLYNASESRHPSSRPSSSRQSQPYTAHSQGSSRRPSVPSSSHSAVSSSSSGLENSEFGARWLKEQGEMLKKRVALPGATSTLDPVKGKRRDSSASGASSEDESLASLGDGALALERDKSGKWYYNYSAWSSRDSFASDGGDRRFSRSTASSSSALRPITHGPSSTVPSSASASGSSSYQTHGRPVSFFSDDSNAGGRSSTSYSYSTDPSNGAGPSSTEAIPLEVLRIAAEESGVVEPPMWVPECSACKVRMTYMRYACVKCGEKEKCDIHGNVRPPPRRYIHHPPHGPEPHSAHAHPHHHHHHHHHAHSPSIDQHARIVEEQPEDEEDDGYASDGTELVGHRKHSTSSSSSGGSTSLIGHQKPLPRLPPLDDSPSAPGGSSRMSPHGASSSSRGFELCASCIESHGHEHSKEFFKRRTETGGWDFIGRGEDVLSGGHAFREIVWSGMRHGGWTDVEYDDEGPCSICSADISRNRHKCVSCPKFDLCKQCYQRVEDIHPVHAFLSVPDKEGAAEPENLAPVQIQHPGTFCHNCLKNIVGARFHCAICPSWDLCADCESLPSTGTIGGTHSSDHIMMKIPVPLGNAEVEQVSRRVRDQWLLQDSQTVAAQTLSRNRAAHTSLPTSFAPQSTSTSPVQSQLSPPAQQTSPSTSPPLATFPPPPLHPARAEFPGAFPASQPGSISRRDDSSAARPSPWSLNFSRNGISFRRTSSGTGSSAPALTSPPTTARISPPAAAMSTPPAPRSGHRCSCDNCGTYLNGTRYQCANCSSDPTPYNLCPACEAKSYLVHDDKHAFIRFDRPVDFQLRPRTPLLPLLYSVPVGRTLDPAQPPMRADVAERLVAVRNQNDPTAHLRFLYHPSTVCDFCMIPITGCWFRCAVCPSSFDLCSDCHRSIEHDRDHVFLVLKSSVDMQVFRECTALSSETSRPMIQQRLYLPS